MACTLPICRRKEKGKITFSSFQHSCVSWSKAPFLPALRKKPGPDCLPEEEARKPNGHRLPNIPNAEYPDLQVKSKRKYTAKKKKTSKEERQNKQDSFGRMSLYDSCRKCFGWSGYGCTQRTARMLSWKIKTTTSQLDNVKKTEFP